MFNVRHLLTGEELSLDALEKLLSLSEELKQERLKGHLRTDLAGKTLALLFEKPSLRTRFSFSVGMTELGGSVVESQSADRKKEDPEDLARVLNGYCHGIVLRTHEQSNLGRMALASSVP